jgi:hypothetical protein
MLNWGIVKNCELLAVAAPPGVRVRALIKTYAQSNTSLAGPCYSTPGFRTFALNLKGMAAQGLYFTCSLQAKHV